MHCPFSANSISPTTTVVSDVDFTENFADDILRPSLLDSDSYFEVWTDYYDLPSKLVSVYHTGAPWKEAQRVPKEARPICEVWDELGPQVPDRYKEGFEGLGRPTGPTDDDALAKERKKISEVIDTLQ